MIWVFLTAYLLVHERGVFQLFYQKIDTQKELTNRGLVSVPRPRTIPAPIPIPAPVPIQRPEPLPRPSVLPGTSTVEQYHTPEQAANPAAVTGFVTRLAESGAPAIGQYLPPPRRRGSAGTRAAAAREATRQRLTAPQRPPATVATGQIRLPGPGRFWSGTAAARRVTLPRPEVIWSGAPTTSQITLPKPEDFWRR